MGVSGWEREESCEGFGHKDDESSDDTEIRNKKERNGDMALTRVMINIKIFAKLSFGGEHEGRFLVVFRKDVIWLVIFCSIKLQIQSSTGGNDDD